MNLITTVIASLRFEATHNWPGVLESLIPDIGDVAYLRHPHRHEFHIRVWKSVGHDDREVEIIMLKHQVAKQLQEWYPKNELGPTSCETLATRLVEAFNLEACEVLEDGENGAHVQQVCGACK